MGGGGQAFFGGLLGSLGQGVLNNEQQEYQKKLKDNDARRRAAEIIANSEDVDPSTHALALRALIAPTMSGGGGGIGGLIKGKGGKGKGQQQPDPLNQLFESIGSMGKPKPQGQPATAQPQTEQVPTPSTSTPPMPKTGAQPAGGPPTATSAMPNLTMRQQRMQDEEQLRVKQQKDVADQEWEAKKAHALEIDPTKGEEYRNYLKGTTPRQSMVPHRLTPTPITPEEATAMGATNYDGTPPKGKSYVEQIGDRLVSIPFEEKSAPDRLAPEISAQVGKKPDPQSYPGGDSDPKYTDALKQWGKKAQSIKAQEAAVGGEARAKAYGEYRPVSIIDPKDGTAKMVFAKTAIGEGAAPLSGGTAIMSKEAQFNEMHTAVQKARDAINKLDLPFSPTQIAKLTMAMRQTEPTIFHQEIDSLAGSQELTPAQQDFVVWVGQLNERAMSLRNVAGMGQGAQDLRNAIQATLPSVKSGDKPLMLKQLGAFENQLTLLEKGIPKINRLSPMPNMNSGATAGGTVKMRAPNGQEKDVPSDRVDYYKSKGAKVIQ